MQQNIVSETVFEQFCDAKEVLWEPIPTEAATGKKTPDYFIFPSGVKIAAEVKEVTPNASEREQERQLNEIGWSTGGGTVGERARNLINTAAKQLRAKAKGRWPAIVVIYNPDRQLRHHTEPHAIKAAMYGFDTLVLGLSSDVAEKPRLLDRTSGPGRTTTDQHNTTISAVCVLDNSGLIPYHNLFAKMPLSAQIFKGIALRQYQLGRKRQGEFVEWVEISAGHGTQIP